MRAECADGWGALCRVEEMRQEGAAESRAEELRDLQLEANTWALLQALVAYAFR
jgi:hypothetical protein